VGLKTPRVFNERAETMFGQIQLLGAMFNNGELTPREYKRHVVNLLLEADDDDLMQFSRAIQLVQA